VDAQRRWQPINSFTGFASMTTFTMLNNVGFGSGWVLGRDGPNSMRTDNGGLSWTFMPVISGLPLPRVALTSIASSSETSVVTVGAGFAILASFLHSTDGRTLEVFSLFDELPILVFMSHVAPVPGVRDKYVALGSLDIISDAFERIEGYAVTVDGGVTWTVSRLDRRVVTSYAIAFGAFPSTNVWYMTGDDDLDGTRPRPNQTEVKKWGVWPTAAEKAAKKFERPVSKNDIGGVYKSNNAGNTWERVYWGSGIQAQKISCPTVTHCWITGKSEVGSQCGRGCIINTVDGGRTWNIQFSENEEWFDWFDLVMQNTLEGFATGGSVLNEEESGKFYRTVDGGRTWQLEVVPRSYPGMLSIDRNGGAYTIGTSSFVTGPVLFKYQ